MKLLEAKLFIVFTAWLIIASILLWSPLPVPWIISTALAWSWPILYVIGILISTRALRQSGHKAYCLFIAYFILAFYSVTIAPLMHERFINRGTATFEDATLDQGIQLQEEMSEVLQSHELPTDHTVALVSLPLGQLLLVAGLWLITKRIKPREHSPPDGRGEAPRP